MINQSILHSKNYSGFRNMIDEPHIYLSIKCGQILNYQNLKINIFKYLINIFSVTSRLNVYSMIQTNA